MTMIRKAYAAIDLHSQRSMIGWMTPRGRLLDRKGFATSEDNLVHWVSQIKAREVLLTIEAGPLTRWAANILRPRVARLLVCEPRYNKLVSSSIKKSDEVDVETLCELYRLNALKEVWMGRDEGRSVFRAALYELYKLRDAHRQLKAHIKTRYRGEGILSLDGSTLFHPQKRERWIEKMPPARRHGLLLLYDLFDTAYGGWADQLREVLRLGKPYPEIERFMEVPGIGEIGAHGFSAMVEDPNRFETSQQLFCFCALAITSRSSDNKPLGYERLGRAGRRELKTISYHAWRVGVRANQSCDVVRRFYLASKERTGSVRHARLNTQRKILKTLWIMWKTGSHFDPDLFLQTPKPQPAGRRRRRRRPRRTRSRRA